MAGNPWNLSVGCLAILEGNELQKVFSSSEWRWYERHVDGASDSPQRQVAVPRRDGEIIFVAGNCWEVVETITDSRGPYHSWVIYQDKDIRAVFRHVEVALGRSPWVLDSDG